MWLPTMLLTMVAVKGMLSMREEARAETHITKMMAMAKRWSSGTAWEGRDGEEQVRSAFITAHTQAANLAFKPDWLRPCRDTTGCSKPPEDLLLPAFYPCRHGNAFPARVLPIGWGAWASQSGANTPPVTCDYQTEKGPWAKRGLAYLLL